jgi:hypothetical protein
MKNQRSNDSTTEQTNDHLVTTSVTSFTDNNQMSITSNSTQSTQSAQPLSITTAELITSPKTTRRGLKLSASHDSLLNVTLRKKNNPSNSSRPGSATSVGFKTFNNIITGSVKKLINTNTNNNNNNLNIINKSYDKPLTMRRSVSKDSIDSIGANRREREKENRKIVVRLLSIIIYLLIHRFCLFCRFFNSFFFLFSRKYFYFIFQF